MDDWSVDALELLHDEYLQVGATSAVGMFLLGVLSEQYAFHGMAARNGLPGWLASLYVDLMKHHSSFDGWWTPYQFFRRYGQAVKGEPDTWAEVVAQWSALRAKVASTGGSSSEVRYMAETLWRKTGDVRLIPEILWGDYRSIEASECRFYYERLTGTENIPELVKRISLAILDLKLGRSPRDLKDEILALIEQSPVSVDAFVGALATDPVGLADLALIARPQDPNRAIDSRLMQLAQSRRSALGNRDCWIELKLPRTLVDLTVPSPVPTGHAPI